MRTKSMMNGDPVLVDVRGMFGGGGRQKIECG